VLQDELVRWRKYARMMTAALSAARP